jgi:siroheme synthase (precorrin-2 oxidase/ferrochelatase)
MKTITNREINVTANHSAMTFTIRTNGSKYRTIQLSKEEFKSCLNNTGNDWAEFLKSSDYYKVS